MAGYALGRDGEPGGSEDFDPSMYYIYQLLTLIWTAIQFHYSQRFGITQFNGYLSYIMPTRIFNNSDSDQQKLRINGETCKNSCMLINTKYKAINCRLDGILIMHAGVCLWSYHQRRPRNVQRYLRQHWRWSILGICIRLCNEVFVCLSFALWNGTNCMDVSFLKLVCEFIISPCLCSGLDSSSGSSCSGSNVMIDLMFSITRGDQSDRSRAFASLQSSAAIEGIFSSESYH